MKTLPFHNLIIGSLAICVFYGCTKKEEKPVLENQPVIENQSPTCNITSPISGHQYTKGDTIIISVEAYDEDGTIAGVEFFLNGVEFGSSNSFPHNYIWVTDSANPGINSIRAVSTDDKGEVAADVVSILLKGNITFPVWDIDIILPELSFYQISVVNSNVAYILGKDFVFGAWKQFLFRTIDGGSSWDLVYETPDGINCPYYNLHFSTEDKGFMTGYRTLYTTYDGGMTWDTTDLGMNNFSWICEQSSGRLFGGGQSGFYRSEDGGDTWIRFGGFNNMLRIFFLDEYIGYVSGFMNDDRGIFKTMDGGLTWEKISQYRINFLAFIDQTIGYGVWIDYDNWGNSTWNFSRSKNSGLTWSKESLENVTDTPSHFILGKDGFLYLSSDEGVYKFILKQDNWIQEISGYEINRMAFMGDKLLAVGAGGVVIIRN